MAVSLRVPEQVKKRIASRAAFHAEASRRLKSMKKAGIGIPADEVFAYLTSRAAGKPAVRPRSRKVA